MATRSPSTAVKLRPPSTKRSISSPSRSPSPSMRSLNTGVSKEKKLFTPGPLNTAKATKEAMLRDIGSRDPEFLAIIKDVRNQLLELAGVASEEFTCIPLQGSGTYSIEAVFSTTVPKDGGKVLILENGAYGRRQADICQILDIPHHVESFGDGVPADAERVEEILIEDLSFTHVALVHCETSTGLFNPILKIGGIVKHINPDITYFVDAMSSFGAVPLDMKLAQIDYMVSSANKNFEGVPGWSYVIAKTGNLLAAKGNARSLCLDLVSQYEGFEMNGQFRFTPPCQSILAFQQALLELKKEGGIQARAKRYKENNRLLRLGMAAIGFQQFLKMEDAGYIVTTFLYPKSPKFIFEDFYNALFQKGHVIYPGKLSNIDCFRLGNIGQLYPQDMQNLVVAIRRVLEDMGISLPLD